METDDKLSLIAEILYLREINYLQNVIIANKGTEERRDNEKTI